MRRSLFALVVVVLLLFATSAIDAVPLKHDSFCEEGDCSELTHVVVRLAKRDDARAALIAEQHDMRVVGQPFLNSHYFFQHMDDVITSIIQKHETVEQLSNSADVKWVKVQRRKRRVKLNFLRSEQNAADARETDGRPDIPIWNDPLFPDQWYLNKGAVGNYDMNVREAWQLGYSGRGVVVSIVDDGLQRDHLDLQANYDPLASTDINDNDDDPTPRHNDNEWNGQGTMCASIVAASAGNKHCGVGVAYNAKIGGIRMLDGMINDSVEGKALSFRQDHIDIYSSSWGPKDNGSTFEGPGPLARQAFFEGVTKVL